jgi:hypothetical protein
MMDTNNFKMRAKARIKATIFDFIDEFLFMCCENHSHAFSVFVTVFDFGEIMPTVLSQWMLPSLRNNQIVLKSETPCS